MRLVKHRYIVAAAIIACILVASYVYVNLQPTAPSIIIRIMPLGDSITRGSPIDPRVGYRQKLYLDLRNAGFNVDFVGNLSDGEDASPSFDTDHEGHGGWSIDQIRRNVYSFLIENPADIILLHIGTNDLYSRKPSVGRVGDILNEVDRWEADSNLTVHVFVALIIQRIDNTTKNEWTKTFNDEVEVMVQQRIAIGDQLTLVDMENALTYPDDMHDGLHPNMVGYNKMATVWFNALLIYFG